MIQNYRRDHQSAAAAEALARLEEKQQRLRAESKAWQRREARRLELVAAFERWYRSHPTDGNWSEHSAHVKSLSKAIVAAGFEAQLRALSPVNDEESLFLDLLLIGISGTRVALSAALEAYTASDRSRWTRWFNNCNYRDKLISRLADGDRPIESNSRPPLPDVQVDLRYFDGPKSPQEWRKHFGTNGMPMPQTTFRDHVKSNRIVVHSVTTKLIYVHKESVQRFTPT